MRRFLILALGILSFVGLAAVDGSAQDLGTLHARKLPPIAHPGPSTPAKQLFRPCPVAERSGDAQHRVLFARLPCRRHRAAGQRAGLAGDAAVAQPQLGHAAAHRLSRTLRPRSAARQPLAGHSRRRHVAAARRPDADRPRLASDRPRRRYLAEADAALHAVARAARRDDVDQCRARGSARCRSALLDAGPSRT